MGNEEDEGGDEMMDDAMTTGFASFASVAMVTAAHHYHNDDQRITDRQQDQRVLRLSEDSDDLTAEEPLTYYTPPLLPRDAGLPSTPGVVVVAAELEVPPIIILDGTGEAHDNEHNAIISSVGRRGEGQQLRDYIAMLERHIPLGGSSPSMRGSSESL